MNLEIEMSNDSDAIRELIAITLKLIEKRFALVKNDADLLSAAEQLNSLIVAVEHLSKAAMLIAGPSR